MKQPAGPVRLLEHVQKNYRSSMGRSTVVIECPCCGTDTTAYVWSLAGSGKRCECGAKHTLYGTIPPAKPPRANDSNGGDSDVSV